jgi:hypothetical protein
VLSLPLASALLVLLLVLVGLEVTLVLTPWSIPS